MSIAAHKCTSIRVVTTKDSWYISDTNLLLVGGAQIPYSAADSKLTYLGGHISPWSGLQHDYLMENLRLSLVRLRCAPLKPHQKLHLPTTYILPHFLYTTVLAIPPISTIRDMDSLIRTHVKDILHLPACKPNGLIYCSKCDGGLGVPKLETLATTTVLKQELSLLNTQDRALHALLTATNYEARLEKMAKAIRLTWKGLTIQQIDAHKRSMNAQNYETGVAFHQEGKALRPLPMTDSANAGSTTRP